MFAVYFTIAFQFIPVLLYLFLSKINKTNYLNIGVLFVVLASLLCNVIGIIMANYGQNTNAITNIYILVSKPLECTLLILPMVLKRNLKFLLISISLIVAIIHFISCLPYSFLRLNDYTTMLASAYVSVIALFAIYNLVNHSISLKSSIHPFVIPAIAIFTYSSITFIPTMITNIDDIVEFPSLIIDLRLWVVIIANLVRDTLLGIYFFKQRSTVL